MRGIAWRVFERQRDDLFHVLIGDLSGRARPRLVEQPGHALRHEPATPAAHRLARHPRLHPNGAVIATG
jgi:hypothetical protein